MGCVISRPSQQGRYVHSRCILPYTWPCDHWPSAPARIPGEYVPVNDCGDTVQHDGQEMDEGKAHDSRTVIMAVSTILSPSIVSNRPFPYRTEPQHLGPHQIRTEALSHLPPPHPPPVGWELGGGRLGGFFKWEVGGAGAGGGGGGGEVVGVGRVGRVGGGRGGRGGGGRWEAGGGEEVGRWVVRWGCGHNAGTAAIDWDALHNWHLPSLSLAEVARCSGHFHPWLSSWASSAGLGYCTEGMHNFCGFRPGPNTGANQHHSGN